MGDIVRLGGKSQQSISGNREPEDDSFIASILIALSLLIRPTKWDPAKYEITTVAATVLELEVLASETGSRIGTI